MRLTLLLLPFVAIALSACGPQVQDTSGAVYLKGYDVAHASTAPTSATGRPRIDPEIAEIAAVEPILRFPARIGLARIVNGRLTGIPTAEHALWVDFAKRHPGLGTFVSVSTLIAEMVDRAPRTCRAYRCDAREVVDKIRRGAARQHLDAVLIYEVGARSSKTATLLALADVTLIGGAILPTREIDAHGIARALLVDVRNGYPYATTETTTDLSIYTPSFGSDGQRDALRDKAIQQAVAQLIPEVEAIAHQLLARAAARARVH